MADPAVVAIVGAPGDRRREVLRGRAAAWLRAKTRASPQRATVVVLDARDPNFAHQLRIYTPAHMRKQYLGLDNCAAGTFDAPPLAALFECARVEIAVDRAQDVPDWVRRRVTAWVHVA